MTDLPRTFPRLSDLLLAAGLLTRLPVPALPGAGAADHARAAWAWPVLGAGLGAVAGCIGWALHASGAPAGLAAAVMLAALALATGALHEDGLADMADGLGARGDRAARLAAMRDSRIGAFGVLALVLVTLARFACLAALLATPALFAALIAAGALSRLGPGCLAALLPPARSDGLAAGLGAPPVASLLLGGLIAGGCAVAGFGLPGLWLVLWAALAVAFVGLLARRSLGGQTGDVLGASQQMGEAAALAAAAALIA